MATERLTMRKIREVLRLRWQLGRTVREAARGLGVSAGVVSKMSTRAAKAGLTWEVVETLDDATLEERLYGRPTSPSKERPRPDPVHIHTELRRLPVCSLMGPPLFRVMGPGRRTERPRQSLPRIALGVHRPNWGSSTSSVASFFQDDGATPGRRRRPPEKGDGGVTGTAFTVGDACPLCQRSCPVC